VTLLFVVVEYIMVAGRKNITMITYTCVRPVVSTKFECVHLLLMLLSNVVVLACLLFCMCKLAR